MSMVSAVKHAQALILPPPNPRITRIAGLLKYTTPIPSSPAQKRNYTLPILLTLALASTPYLARFLRSPTHHREIERAQSLATIETRIREKNDKIATIQSSIRENLPAIYRIALNAQANRIQSPSELAKTLKTIIYILKNILTL